MLSYFSGSSKPVAKKTVAAESVDTVESHNIYTENEMSDTEQYNIYTSDDDSESEFVTQGEKSSRNWKQMTKKVMSKNENEIKNGLKWKQMSAKLEKSNEAVSNWEALSSKKMEKSSSAVSNWEKVISTASNPVSSPNPEDFKNSNDTSETKKDVSSSSSPMNKKNLSITIPTDAEVHDKEYQDKVEEAKSYNYKFSRFNVLLPKGTNAKNSKKPEAGNFIRERGLEAAFDKFMTKVVVSSHTGGCFVAVKKYSSAKLAKIMLEFEAQFAAKGVQIIVCKEGSNSMFASSAAKFWIEFVDIDAVGPLYRDRKSVV